MTDDAGAIRIADASFAVRAGEIVGVVALENSGHQLLLRAIAGRKRPSAGTSESTGRVALIPEDRQRDAIIMSFSLTENVALKGSGWARGLTRWSAWRTRTARLLQRYDVRASSVDAPAKTLSGGNQQKLVLARELSRDPRLVIAFQPTRGLDVGAIEFVYGELNEKKKAGGAILLISFELDEIFTMADRFAVMVGGRFMRVLDGAEADLETVGMLMGGAEEAR